MRAPRVALAPLAVACAALALPGAGARADRAALPHLATIRGTVRGLDGEAGCAIASPVRATCRWTHATPRRAFDLHLVYDDETRTVYVYVARLARVDADDPAGPARLAEMMAWNGRWLVGKLEWNPHDGEVRLSAVLPAGDAFDGDALRATIATLTRLAARHHAALEGDGDGADPPGPAPPG